MIKVSEKEIENSILQFLELKGFYAIKHNRVGIYDPKLKQFRVSNNRFNRTGVADVEFFYYKDRAKEGVLPKKFTIFLEVKSKKGVQSDTQKLFQINVEKAGCIYRVVRSIDDVQMLLDELEQ
jgi:hypothetical protein